MPLTFSFLLVYLISESLAYFVFRKVRKHFLGHYGSTRPMWNGIIERAFLYLCLFTEIHHGFTLFGALKIGTRLKADENKISNDYFLIGNMISVGIILLTAYIYQNGIL
jgi:hypothetical protein